jgi:hypothetical protein
MSSKRFEQAATTRHFSDLLGRLGRLGKICMKSGCEPAVLYAERKTRHCAAQDEPASRKGEQRQIETRECEALP